MAARDLLSGLRVCLVTPGHPSTNPRLVKEADALVECGAVVRVVHGRFLPWAERTDAVFADRNWRRDGVPFGPQAGRAIWLRQGIALRAARLGAAMGLPVRAESTFHPVVPALAAAAAREPADVYIGHNLAGGIAAARAARRHGAALGFDAEDDHVGELPDQPDHGGERARRQAILERLLHQCVHRTAASPRIAATLVAEHGVAVTPVLNVFPRADVAGLEPVVAAAPSLYWLSQTIGPQRGLESIVDVLPLLPPATTLVLRGEPRQPYIDGLRERLRAAGGDPLRFVVEPVLAPDRVTASFHGHALALSLEIGDCRNHHDCLGNKIFHALLAGTPVLLSDTPAQRELAPALGPAALCVDLADRTGLATRLRGWLADAAGRDAAARHAWDLARRRYCWDVEKGVFLRALRDALAGAGVVPR
jgi:glycosyltransferase involved in cell wall biosynthesis